MAESIPAFNGVPPAPPGANVTQHSRETGATGEAVNLPGQRPGFVEQQSNQNSPAEAEYAEFLAWKQQQGKQAQVDSKESTDNSENSDNDEDVEPITDPRALLDLMDSAAESDPVLASQVRVLRSAFPKLDLQRAIGNALIYSDPKLVDAAYIREVSGENAADAVELAKGLVAYAEEAAQRAVSNIYEAAGGKANWNAATAAFNKSAPPHIRTAVKTLMGSGDHKSIRAAADMVVDFAKSSGQLHQQNGQPVAPGAGQPQNGGPLGKLAFQEAHAKLDRSARDYEEQRAQLFQRRQLGKNMGIN